MREVDVQYLEKLLELRNDLPFLLRGLRWKKSKSLELIYMIKLNMLYTEESENKH